MDPMAYALLLCCFGCSVIGCARTAVWMLDRTNERRVSEHRAFVMVEEAKREARRQASA